MNIVLAKTPYHVLLAHAALASEGVLSGKATLIYLGIDGPAVRSLIDWTNWDAVHFFSFPSKRISRKSARAARCFLSANKLCSANVLLTCNDVNWRTQLFISQISFSSLVVAEDGFAAYANYHRNLAGWLYAETYLRLFYSDVTFHYGKMNRARADMYLSISSDAFPWCPESRKKVVFEEFSRYCFYLSSRLDGGWNGLSSTSAVLMTQPLSDQGHWRFRDEMAVYSRMLGSLAGAGRVLVKKHPAEGFEGFSRKMSYLKEWFKDLSLEAIYSDVPIEVIVGRLPPGARIFSIVSTGALNASLMREDLQVFCDRGVADKIGGRWPVGFL